ncbi:30S ribosomal protein S2, partial [Candidatus Gottesmanbacteria bacterium RBG_13_37_7]
KTKERLLNAANYLKSLGEEGRLLLMVATKRQAKSVVKEAAVRAGIMFLTTRWVGGMMTNWEEVKKNIDKLNKFRQEATDGSWSKFPKHEMMKLQKHLKRLETVYGGIAQMKRLPDAIFIVDIKNELIAFRESLRKNVPVVAIVDTNVDPGEVDYPIPSNDDAVGSIKIITDFLAEAFLEGSENRQKRLEKEEKKTKASEEMVQAREAVIEKVVQKEMIKETVKPEKPAVKGGKKSEKITPKKEEKAEKKEKPKKLGRPKKIKK